MADKTEYETKYKELCIKAEKLEKQLQAKKELLVEQEQTFKEALDQAEINSRKAKQKMIHDFKLEVKLKDTITN